ncbi:hypothetical protein CRENBAI_012601 [Crenichthys baileyi]|uniref:Uncharacterized protein n=1 Tax=Crenichthys baileyi TaxID=28760 RepID=A0AAV9SIL3_9TELE
MIMCEVISLPVNSPHVYLQSHLDFLIIVPQLYGGLLASHLIQPRQSPDLKLLESLWRELKIRVIGKRPSNLKHDQDKVIKIPVETRGEIRLSWNRGGREGV